MRLRVFRIEENRLAQSRERTVELALIEVKRAQDDPRRGGIQLERDAGILAAGVVDALAEVGFPAGGRVEALAGRTHRPDAVETEQALVLRLMAVRRRVPVTERVEHGSGIDLA